MQKRHELTKITQLAGDDDESAHSNYQSFNDSEELYMAPASRLSADYEDDFYTTGKLCALTRDRILECALNFA